MHNQLYTDKLLINRLRSRCRLYLALAVVFFLGMSLFVGAWVSLVLSINNI